MSRLSIAQNNRCAVCVYSIGFGDIDTCVNGYYHLIGPSHKVVLLQGDRVDRCSAQTSKSLCRKRVKTHTFDFKNARCDEGRKTLGVLPTIVEYLVDDRIVRTVGSRSSFQCLLVTREQGLGGRRSTPGRWRRGVRGVRTRASAHRYQKTEGESGENRGSETGVWAHPATLWSRCRAPDRLSTRQSPTACQAFIRPAPGAHRPLINCPLTTHRAVT